MKKYLGIVLISLLLCTNVYASKESIKKEIKSSKTIQEKDRERLEEKFSEKKKETIN